MDFDEYQASTAKTAIYPGQGSVTGLLYVSLGLGEAGEIQGKAKKVLRDDDGLLTIGKVEAMSAELGDLLWYAAQLATELGVSLSDVAQANLDKLQDRMDRGVLGGSGDDR